MFFLSMNIYVHIYLCTYIYLYIYLSFLSINIYVYIYLYDYISIYLSMYLGISTYILMYPIYEYIYLYLPIYLCIWVDIQYNIYMLYVPYSKICSRWLETSFSPPFLARFRTMDLDSFRKGIKEEFFESSSAFQAQIQLKALDIGTLVDSPTLRALCIFIHYKLVRTHRCSIYKNKCILIQKRPNNEFKRICEKKKKKKNGARRTLRTRSQSLRFLSFAPRAGYHSYTS